MAIKLHRCSLMFFKLDAHPCHRVQKALDEQGVDYEIVKEPLSRSKRAAVQSATGQQKLPVIEFDDGTFYRAESGDMAARIRAGELGTTA